MSSGSGTYHYGDTATVAATANPGYNFVNWTENGTIVSTDENYSFTVNNNHNLTANFDLLMSTRDIDYEGVGLYPNPAINFVNILSKEKISLVEVYNMKGQKVMNSNSNKLNVSNLIKGIYLIKIILINGKTETIKILKQ
ncbi:MAG: T9SS type A sorting domain-containing protein [Weeksellaceae bacterium]